MWQLHDFVDLAKTSHGKDEFQQELGKIGQVKDEI